MNMNSKCLLKLAVIVAAVYRQSNGACRCRTGLQVFISQAMAASTTRKSNADYTTQLGQEW